MSLQNAFFEVCKDAKPAPGFYVCLMQTSSRYGGPEESGWWTHDTVLVAYQEFPTEEQAEAARIKVEELARELSLQEQRGYGEHCQRTLEWLDARGLDADYLPEPDGPDEYSVCVTEELPTNSYGPTRYE